METQRQEEEMAEEEEEEEREIWEETVWRVKHIVKTNGDIRIRSGRIFLSREDEEKYGRVIAEAVMDDDLRKFLAITKDNYFMDQGRLYLQAFDFTLLTRIVAREKVMAPMSGDLERSPNEWTYQGYEGLVDYSYEKNELSVAEFMLDPKYVYDVLPIGHNIVHRLLLELGLLANESITLEKTAQENPESYCFCEESQQVLWAAYQLILIFKRVGEALGAYIQSDHSSLSSEQIIEEVAVLLMDAGYKLTYRDIDLKDAFRFENIKVTPSKEDTQEPEEWSLPAKFSMPDGSLSQVYQNRMLVLKQSPSFRWNNHPCGMISAAFDPRRKFQTSCSPRANCKFNSLVTKEIPVKKFANVIAQSVYQPKSSSEQLQFIVSALKGLTPHI